MTGVLSPGKPCLREQLADLHLDEVEHLGIVDRVALVHEHDDRRNADLAREQDVLVRLRHRAVGRRDDEDRPVHLRRARDHVLHVVGVARAVDVRVVALGRLVLDVRRVDRDPALPLLGGVVDLVVRLLLRHAPEGEQGGDRRGERGLAVVDVTDRADVHVWFRALEGFLGHVGADSCSLDLTRWSC